MATSTHKITPHLWFDKEAREAAEFYTSLFPDSKITNITQLHDTPSGDSDIVSFELAGQPFMAISAGPLFKFNPSISFQVQCRTKDEAQTLWERLSDQGMVLMEFGEYPWSEGYGWTQDRFGLSWQIFVLGENATDQKIRPHLMFVGDVYGKAEEAINFYLSVFHDARVQHIDRRGEGVEPDTPGSVLYAMFTLEGMEFATMESAYDHAFSFNEAISFMVSCDTQDEIDYYWEKLSAVPEAEQCGWLKDKYGVSWQIVPARMDEMMQTGNPEQMARVTEAFLKMKKFDIAELERAYAGS